MQTLIPKTLVLSNDRKQKFANLLLLKAIEGRLHLVSTLERIELKALAEVIKSDLQKRCFLPADY